MNKLFANSCFQKAKQVFVGQYRHLVCILHITPTQRRNMNINDATLLERTDVT